MSYGYDPPRGVHPIRKALSMPVGIVRLFPARLKWRGVLRETARPWQDALPPHSSNQTAAWGHTLGPVFTDRPGPRESFRYCIHIGKWRCLDRSVLLLFPG